MSFNFVSTIDRRLEGCLRGRRIKFMFCVTRQSREQEENKSVWILNVWVYVPEIKFYFIIPLLLSVAVSFTDFECLKIVNWFQNKNVAPFAHFNGLV